MKPQDILQRISDYIYIKVGRQDWQEHTSMISGYLGAGLQMPEQNVRKALNMCLKHKEIIADIDRNIEMQMKQEKQKYKGPRPR